MTEATGESGYVSCWTGTDVMIMAVAEGSHAVRVAGLRVGLASDVHARSSGKALLPFGSLSRLETLLDRLSAGLASDLAGPAGEEHGAGLFRGPPTVERCLRAVLAMMDVAACGELYEVRAHSVRCSR